MRPWEDEEEHKRVVLEEMRELYPEKHHDFIHKELHKFFSKGHHLKNKYFYKHN